MTRRQACDQAKSATDGSPDVWTAATDEEGFADRMNSLPKLVVTSSLDRLVHALTDAGLIDEYHVRGHPVTRLRPDQIGAVG
jgi:hypothetical protein